jgi:aminopeptidase N
MNRFSFLFSLFLFISLSIQGQSIDKKGSDLCSQKKMNSPLQLLSDNLNSTGTHSFDIINYNLDLDIYKCFLTPYPSSYKGTEILTLLADSTFNSINLNAINTSLQIDSVRLSGSNFTHVNNVLTVNLDRSYSSGETLYVKIYFQHKNVTDGAFYVKTGMVFTDCEPEGARKWFPCWDKPSDKATMNLKVITPGSVKLGSNGRLADSVKSNDTIYYKWISRDPVATYLMVISAKVNYNLDIKYWHKISNPLDSIPFRFYWNAGESGLANIETKVLQMCDRFSILWGEHPFEKNGFATLNSQFAWGGMENQTLTNLCPNCWSENLVSHEFSHQWFGDMITCATWADIFLNEGFATFCEAIWYETTGGYSSYKSDINNDASYYLSNNPGWAISNPDWAVNTPDVNTLFNTATTYDKGACVLHQLRYVMGDSLFFIGMHNYGTSDFRYKSATIGDYAAIMSTAYGQDLSWFFNEWIYQPNHPVYSNKYYISQKGTNTWEVGFQAIQTQTNTVFFQMPLQIAINYSSGPADTLRIFNNVNNQLFTFKVTKQPTSVVFDPKNNIVLKTATLTQVSPMPVVLNLIALIEAMYVYGGTAMPMTPSVTVELHNSVSPYTFVESKTATLNSAGVGTFTFTSAANNTPYYIVFKYLNTIETWSAAPQSFTSGALNYDFTTGVIQAYTDGIIPPLALHNSKYCIYSGDANQDCFVTGDDFMGVDNDASNFAFHIINDLNGDGIITGDDFTYIDNNGSSFIRKQVPAGAPSFKNKTQ